MITDNFLKNTNPTLKKVGNEYYHLSENLKNLNEGDIKYISSEDPHGNKAYERTLCFILDVALRRVIPNYKLRIEYSMSKGLFCQLVDRNEITIEEIDNLNREIRNIISSKLNITKKRVSIEEAKDIFQKQGSFEKRALLEYYNNDFIDLFLLDDIYGHFYGDLAENTSAIKYYSLKKYKDGMVLLYPSVDEPDKIPEFKPVETLYEIFQETGAWDKIIGLNNLASLNDVIRDGRGKKLISISEGLHEKKYVNIANEISSNKRIKIVLLSGPSSSGKTTSSKRLAVQLSVNGLKPFPIEMDNYFVNRIDTPKLPDGSYDFESLRAIDIDLFNSDMDKLIKGDEVRLPKFNFKTGIREDGELLKIPDNGILIVEGIHALNPVVLENIKDRFKYKIYVSALTQLNLDNLNRMSTTDVRKLRRMVRDYNKRGYSAEETLNMFKGVTRGEKEYIFPYQSEADIMFNSTIAYELPVLKKHALPLLKTIKKDSPAFEEAKRLITILDFVCDMEDTYIPPNSVLREFIGGSFFD